MGGGEPIDPTHKTYADALEDLGRQRPPVDEDGAAHRPVARLAPRQHVQQRRLARAGPAHERAHLARVDAPAGALQQDTPALLAMPAPLQEPHEGAPLLVAGLGGRDGVDHLAEEQPDAP